MWFVGLYALLAFEPSSAASYRNFSEKDKLLAAHLVIHADVVSVEQGLRGGVPHTCTLFQIRKTLAGKSLSNHINICNRGGLIGTEGLRVSGMPEYVLGQEVILFLRDDSIPYMALERGQITVVDQKVYNENHSILSVESVSGKMIRSPYPAINLIQRNGPVQTVASDDKDHSDPELAEIAMDRDEYISRIKALAPEHVRKMATETRYFERINKNLETYFDRQRGER